MKEINFINPRAQKKNKLTKAWRRNTICSTLILFIVMIIMHTEQYYRYRKTKKRSATLQTKRMCIDARINAYEKNKQLLYKKYQQIAFFFFVKQQNIRLINFLKTLLKIPSSVHHLTCKGDMFSLIVIHQSPINSTASIDYLLHNSMVESIELSGIDYTDNVCKTTISGKLKTIKLSV